jgi:uncharacterized repeat protein (TIGR01451 family)
MRKTNKIIILLGALMILASLVWMAEPYYTWAQEQNDANPCRVRLDYEGEDESLFRLENLNPGDVTTKTVTVVKTGSSSARLYMTWDWVDGNPELGDLGSLFEQLRLTIIRDGEILYDAGRMSENPFITGDPLITDDLYLGFMNQGDEMEIEFTVILPGPETGNEFQGSKLVTNLVFYTICSEEEDRTPAINIEKYTNGIDADVPNGPFIPVGGNVTWTYEVTNPGRVPLSNVTVTDNISGVNPVFVNGDTNGNGLLDVGELWLFRANGIAVAGQYANIGTVVGTPPEGPNVTDSDPSHYFGFFPDETEINIEKYTNGVDADLPTGPQITVGGNVTWTYVVTNPNTIPLFNIVVTDNRAGVTPVYVSGDLNGDNVLQPSEVWTYRATGTAVVGQYSNIGTVSGVSAGGKVVTDTDPSHYFGFTPPPQETEVDPEGPQAQPDPEPENDDESSITVPPEGPKQSPPLPRTDGVSIGLLITGMLIMFAGASLKLSNREKEQN